MRFPLALVLMCSAAFAQAAVQTREIPYQDADGNRLVGYYAYDDALSDKRPGVLVVHEWWGLNDYAKRRARELAGLGYNALAIDMYGDGKHTEHPAGSTPAWTCSSCNRRPTSTAWAPWVTASAARWYWTRRGAGKSLTVWSACTARW